jgi:Protein of unknown function (DUF1761)
MKGINRLAIVAAALAAFVASSVWYAVFGNATMELSGTGQDAAANMANPSYTALFVVPQSLVVAFVLSYFVARTDPSRSALWSKREASGDPGLTAVTGPPSDGVWVASCCPGL